MGTIEGVLQPVQHVMLFEDLLGVLFLEETSGPYFSIFDNVHPKDEFGFTKIRHAELFPDSPLRRLDSFE
jgi:hypothetical protein